MSICLDVYFALLQHLRLGALSVFTIIVFLLFSYFFFWLFILHRFILFLFSVFFFPFQLSYCTHCFKELASYVPSL